MTSLPSSLDRPFVWTLPLSQRRIRFVDLTQLGDSGVSKAFQLITDAAKRSDNIGIDEIPTENYFRWLLSYADEAVVLYDDVTSDSNTDPTGSEDSTLEMNGLIVVLPCRYVRSPSPSSCSLIIVTAQPTSTSPIWRDLTRVGFEIGRTGSNHGRHYTGCMIDVFMTCFDRMAALRSEGYVVTSCVPDAGRVARYPHRHVDSYVMYREFGEAQPPPLHLLQSTDDNDADTVPPNVEMRKIPYLPVTYVLKDGSPVLIRNFNGPDDIRLFYTALKSAAASGSGYGADELPSLAYFVEWYISGFYNFVFELLPVDSLSQRNSVSAEGNNENKVGGQGAVIAYMNFGPSLFSRSTERPLLSDGNVVILPRFRGRRWGTEIQNIHMGISYDVGMKHMFGETSMSNLASVMAMRSNGVTLTGSIPRGVFFQETGWTDLVTLHRTLDTEHSFLFKLKQQQGEKDRRPFTAKL